MVGMHSSIRENFMGTVDGDGPTGLKSHLQCNLELLWLDCEDDTFQNSYLKKDTINNWMLDKIKYATKQ